MPLSMRRVIKKYEKDNDIVLQFLEECCEKDPNFTDISGEADPRQMYRIKPKELYVRYRLWAKGEGLFLMSTTKFYSDVERHADWTDGRIVKDGFEYFRGFRLKGTQI